MFEFVVTTSRGLSELLGTEIQDLCPHITPKIKPGQVQFSAELADAYRICLWSRLANRVLLKLNEGEAKQAEDLYTLASAIEWHEHFAVERDFVVDFVGTNRAINNTQFGALKIKDAIVDHFNQQLGERPNVSKQRPDYRIQARLWRDQLSLFLDLSGDSLHQRHYRLRTGDAPVKEHIAAAMLMRSGWVKDKSQALLDPMCGSGTVVIEAALMALNIAPALKREYWGFNAWKGHDSDVWQALIDEANNGIQATVTRIFANDIDKGLVKVAKDNANLASVYDAIKFSHGDATQCSVDTTPGFIVSNPPYGERLSVLTELLPLFQKWGSQLKTHFAGWKLTLLTSNRELLRQLKMSASREYQLMNGKLECQLVNFDISGRNLEVRDESNKSSEFANRLRKNIKGLNKWLKQQDTDCYRLYDADLPEYNVAIDRYADYLVVQEYAPPKDIPEQKAIKRLHEVLVELPSVTGIAAENISLKVRNQQKGKNQYEKLALRNEYLHVHEHGATFKVNLWDYLDTGLFLDHRITRQIVKSLSAGKDVLNLFAYTGSVSVHAAKGGARSVTTVDMSNTYIDWAKENFSLNNLKGAYQFFQADCLTWIAAHRHKYDLIFIDPPSFSNSKRMQTTWDVQRDHVSLLEHAVKCLNPGGTIIFSNNLRQFKLDETGVSGLGLKIDNISSQTLPLDFKRNPKIHHCWKLTAV